MKDLIEFIDEKLDIIYSRAEEKIEQTSVKTLIKLFYKDFYYRTLSDEQIRLYSELFNILKNKIEEKIKNKEVSFEYYYSQKELDDIYKEISDKKNKLESIKDITEVTCKVMITVGVIDHYTKLNNIKAKFENGGTNILNAINSKQDILNFIKNTTNSTTNNTTYPYLKVCFNDEQINEETKKKLSSISVVTILGEEGFKEFIKKDENGEYFNSIAYAYEVICKAYASCTNERDALKNFLKDYFYRRLLNKYRTLDKTEEFTFTNYLPEENESTILGRIFPEVYARLDGTSGIIGNKKTINTSKRFLSYNNYEDLIYDFITEESKNENEIILKIEDKSKFRFLYTMFKNVEDYNKNLYNENNKLINNVLDFILIDNKYYNNITLRTIEDQDECFKLYFTISGENTEKTKNEITNSTTKKISFQTFNEDLFDNSIRSIFAREENSSMFTKDASYEVTDFFSTIGDKEIEFSLNTNYLKEYYPSYCNVDAFINTEINNDAVNGKLLLNVTEFQKNFCIEQISHLKLLLNNKEYIVFNFGIFLDINQQTDLAFILDNTKHTNKPYYDSLNLELSDENSFDGNNNLIVDESTVNLNNIVDGDLTIKTNNREYDIKMFNSNSNEISSEHFKEDDAITEEEAKKTIKIDDDNIGQVQYTTEVLKNKYIIIPEYYIDLYNAVKQNINQYNKCSVRIIGVNG